MKRHRAHRPLSRGLTLLLQALIVIAVLLAWQFVPKIPGISQVSPAFDSFFISSPVQVYQTLSDLFTGNGVTPIWPYIGATMQSFFIGTAIGIVLGATLGILLSNDERLSQVLRPFVVAINAIPRIALIPIIVIIFGPNGTTTTLTAVIVVLFVVFFNAYEGGRSVPTQVVENAMIMGATPRQIILRVRLAYVLAWTAAALPNAVSFGLISVVTAEILTGYAGVGRLLVIAVGSASSSLTFAVVVVLSVLGVALVTLTEALRKRWLHWWSDSQTTR